MLYRERILIKESSNFTGKFSVLSDSRYSRTICSKISFLDRFSEIADSISISSVYQQTVQKRNSRCDKNQKPLLTENKYSCPFHKLFFSVIVQRENRNLLYRLKMVKLREVTQSRWYNAIQKEGKWIT